MQITCFFVNDNPLAQIDSVPRGESGDGVNFFLLNSCNSWTKIVFPLCGTALTLEFFASNAAEPSAWTKKVRATRAKKNN
jgi:hypothetical protein